MATIPSTPPQVQKLPASALLIYPLDPGQADEADELFRSLISAASTMESPAVRIAYHEYRSVDLVEQTYKAAQTRVSFLWQFFIFSSSPGFAVASVLTAASDTETRLRDLDRFNTSVSKFSALDLTLSECRSEVLEAVHQFARFLVYNLITPCTYRFRHGGFASGLVNITRVLPNRF